MSIMEREQQQKHQQQYSIISIPSTSSQYPDNFYNKTTNNPSRRSIDWRDSGIVIDDDYQFNFNSFDAQNENNSNELCHLNLGQFTNNNPHLLNEQATNNRFSFQTSSINNIPSQVCPSQKYVLDQDDDGDTLLHLGVVGFTVEKVSDLIKISNINAINNMMQTPLHVAILANRPEMVELLVKTQGIKLDCFDRRGNAPIHLACQMGMKNIVEILLDSLGSINQQGTENNLERVNDLIELTNFDGQTCLHLAASNNRCDIIETLVKKYRANLNCRDSKSGETILHKAIGKLNIDLVKLILDLSNCHYDLKQRHFNWPDYSGRCPMDKIRMMLESRLEDQGQLTRLNQISQMISEQDRICFSSGCQMCLLSKNESNLRSNTNLRQGAPLSDELDSSSPSTSSSDYSDSDDCEMES